MEQEDKLCDKVETKSEFIYLDDRVIAGGGCEAAETDRIRCGWVKLRECSELLYDRRFPPKLKGTANNSYIMQAILCESESWCL